MLTTLLAIATSTRVSGTDMYGPILTDTTLSRQSSPYNVIGPVTVSEDATLFVENGVEIIFNDNYQIQIFGDINVGCYEYDTSQITSTGLANSNDYTHIHGDITKSRIGAINIDLTNNNYAYAKFCNVLFENLDYAVAETNSKYTNKFRPTYDIDNCEITNVNYATKSTYCSRYWILYENKLSDSYIHDISYVNYYGCIKLDHNIFKNFITLLHDQSYHSGYATIFNNKIYGDDIKTTNCLFFNILSANGVQYNEFYNCVVAIYNNDHNNDEFSRDKIYYNNFTNCSKGIYYLGGDIKYNNFLNNDIAIQRSYPNSWTHDMSVTYNNFINNSIAIDVTSTAFINRNNFIDNDINIRTNTDDINAAHNYYSAGGINQNQIQIASTIIDVCDFYSSGFITFWPWYRKQIADWNNLPSISCTFDYASCDYQGVKTCSITDAPTSEPTNNPSVNPTVSPTRYPTIPPTLNPSNNPTKYPTKHPSFNPTIYPTYYPSIPPTTTYPTSSPITREPTITPSVIPSVSPTYNPSLSPSVSPTTSNPTSKPTNYPTNMPTNIPSNEPSTIYPTASPSYYVGNTENDVYYTSQTGGTEGMAAKFVSLSAVYFILFMYALAA